MIKKQTIMKLLKQTKQTTTGFLEKEKELFLLQFPSCIHHLNHFVIFVFFFFFFFFFRIVFSDFEVFFKKMHHRSILEQFTRQASLFSKGVPLRDPSALQRILKLSKVASTDTVIDFGCGPGIVSCAFGSVAKRVVGVDMTPKMIDLAKEEAKRQNLSAKVSFGLADVYKTGFESGSFDLCVSRFVLHHLEEPAKFLAEMTRVAKSRVILVDVTPISNCAAALNSLEKLRDPSHVKFHTQLELLDLMKNSGLGPPRAESYRVDSLFSEWLQRSFFNNEEDKAEFVRRVSDDVDKTENRKLDLRLRRENGDIYWSHMVSILVAEKQ